MSGSPLIERLRQTVRRFGDKNALAVAGRQDSALTYDAVLDGTERTQSWLAGQGLPVGGRIALQGGQDPLLLPILLAAVESGYWAVLCDPALSPLELDRIVRTLNCQMHVGSAVAPGLPIPSCTLVDVVAQPPTGSATASSPGGVIFLTTGSTGRPKGVVVGARALVNRVDVNLKVTQVSDRDIYLACMLTLTAYGLVMALPPIMNGATVMMTTLPFSPGQVLDALERYRATYTVATPTMWRLLALEQRRLPRRASLRSALIGSDTVTIELLDLAESTFGLPFKIMYGSSEACTTLTGGREGDRIVMHPTPGSAVQLTAELEGELQVKNDRMFTTYDPVPDKAAHNDGWWTSGDLARQLPTGGFELIGRVGHRIRRGQHWVVPTEIEEVLRACPGVGDAAVVGVLHAAIGEMIVAFVVASGSEVPVRTLISWCRERLTAFKLPDLFLAATDLPLINGKIDRVRLKRLAGDQLRERGV